MRIRLINFLLILLTLLASSCAVADVTVPLFFTVQEGKGKPAGQVLIQSSPYGLIFTPQLYGLSPGLHGFHIHENHACDDNGMAAGGHLDPKKTNKHLGPYNNDGHLGDLPVLYVSADGKATTPVLAPRLTLNDIQGHALMLHEGGDNYADEPQKLGGGGARMVCGLID